MGNELAAGPYCVEICLCNVNKFHASLSLMAAGII